MTDRQMLAEIALVLADQRLATREHVLYLVKALDARTLERDAAIFERDSAIRLYEKLDVTRHLPQGAL